MRRTGKPWVAIIGATVTIAALLFAQGPRVAGATVVAPTGPGEAQGYWLETSSGQSFGYGGVNIFPSTSPPGDNGCTDNGCVGIASSTSEGYWLVASSGTAGQLIPGYTGVLIPQGTVSTDNPQCNPEVSGLNAPVVGVAGAGLGAWLVSSDGGIFALCGSSYLGSMGGRPLNAPMVGIAGTHDSHGYWEVAADGGVFSFGDAQFYGSMGGQHLNSPIVGIVATHDGKGYWEIAADGGVFSFGDAQFYGSMGGQHLNSSIVGMTADAVGTGYWMVASDGGVFSFGSAPFLGSGVGEPLDAPIIGMAASPGPPTPV
jgi:hypothetical protein